MRVKITLACTECKQRNYNTFKNKKNDPDRLEFLPVLPQADPPSGSEVKRFPMAKEVEKKANTAKPAKKARLNLKQYLKEMMGEVKKLTWLSVGDLVKHTAMVFVVVLAMSAVIWLLDLGFSAGVKGLATLTGAGTSTSQTAE